MRTRSSGPLGVLLIAVDRFKVVTDTLGHTAGDELMVQITRRFSQVFSSREHVLARWADDAVRTDARGDWQRSATQRGKSLAAGGASDANGIAPASHCGRHQRWRDLG